MYKQLKMRLYLLCELWKSGGFWSALRHKIYSSAEAVPVKKDLSALKTVKTPTEHTDLKLIEITSANVKQRDYHFTQKSRETRVGIYLGKGFCGFGLIKDNQVIGDIWYAPSDLAKRNNACPVLTKFNMQLGDKDVYMFDMFMTSDERGKALTTLFLSMVLEELRKRGVLNAYGFYFKGNVPALWVHRVLGYEELPHYTIRKYLFWRIIRQVRETPKQMSKKMA